MSAIKKYQTNQDKHSRTTTRGERSRTTVFAAMDDDLFQQKNALEQKNAALGDILNLILPIPSRTRRERKAMKLIEKHLRDLTSMFGPPLAQSRHRLSPREVEIANLVKDGQSSRNIAGTLNISVKTVETIRNKIRRKLGLVNKSVNLTSYFRNS